MSLLLVLAIGLQLGSIAFTLAHDHGHHHDHHHKHPHHKEANKPHTYIDTAKPDGYTYAPAPVYYSEMPTYISVKTQTHYTLTNFYAPNLPVNPNPNIYTNDYKVPPMYAPAATTPSSDPTGSYPVHSSDLPYSQLDDYYTTGAAISTTISSISIYINGYTPVSPEEETQSQSPAAAYTPNAPTGHDSPAPAPQSIPSPAYSDYNDYPKMDASSQHQSSSQHDRDRDFLEAKCTWDGVQIPDPEEINPVPTYKHKRPPHKIPQPGPIDRDIQALVGKLGLKEKIGQMTQIEVGQLLDCNGELNVTAVQYWIEEWGVGSFLGTPANHGGKYQWYSAKKFSELTDSVQKIALEYGPKLPIIWGLDSVRGANFIKGAAMFPAGIATAASFNTSLAYDAGRITAKDTRAAGVHWAFAPVSDLSVNKLWPRVYENFGEDPELSARMTAASIRGYQGNYKHDRSRVAACMKHFTGYGYPFDGQDRSNRHIAEHEMLEYYIPPFKAAIDAGVATSMESYGVVNGVPMAMSHRYLQEILRDQLGFKGTLVSDFGEINSQASTYFTARDIRQATWATLNRTSVDMSMVPEDDSFSQTTLDLVKEGYITEARIDESVARILQLKKDLGLFSQPFADPDLLNKVGSAQDVEASRDSVRESVTLLKNKDGVLPLKPAERILYIGPTLNSTRFMGGGWNVFWQGPTDEEGDAVYQGFGDTILDGIKRVTGTEPLYFEGTDIYGSELVDVGPITEAARLADKIVVGLGESPYAEIEGDIGNLRLPQNQLNLVYTVAEASHKPIVVVLVEGRPRILDAVANVADGIVQAYLPGTYGGLPIAEILFGKVNPSGRLPYTYPAFESQASTTIWQPSFSDYNPQWAFGFGLGYSRIEYSNITVSSNSLKVGKPITISLNVTNHGPYAQKEALLLFTNQEYRFDMAPEHMRLRDFAKVGLAVGEMEQISFQLSAEQMGFWDSELKKRIEPSPLNIYINPYTQANIATQVQLDVDPDFILAQA
ncbi:hypothetical protein GGF39_001106 [Coemansia sp. RSA 1721]|nr:hypothetical protein GGF39_001106 [Coemansia sp. RSA 1721]